MENSENQLGYTLVFDHASGLHLLFVPYRIGHRRFHNHFSGTAGLGPAFLLALENLILSKWLEPLPYSHPAVVDPYGIWRHLLGVSFIANQEFGYYGVHHSVTDLFYRPAILLHSVLPYGIPRIYGL